MNKDFIKCVLENFKDWVDSEYTRDRISGILNGYIEVCKIVNEVMSSHLFELNDKRTRQQIASIIEGQIIIGADIEGILNTEVVCDETNNSIKDISNGQLTVWILIRYRGDLDNQKVVFTMGPN